MVRLVFRPYTHVWRTICTSVSLRSSTRVSPGFNLRKHSSPSFGSQHTCSSEYSSSEDFNHSRWGTLSVIIQSISLRLWVYNSRTCTYVRLLGPCFKTGRITTPNNNVKMNKRKQKETKINRTTMAVTKEIEVTTTDEQEQSLLS